MSNQQSYGLFLSDEQFRQLQADPNFVSVEKPPSPFKRMTKKEQRYLAKMFEGAEHYYLTDTGFTDEFGILNEQGKK
jgi:acyl-coenzyme A synthetase/AMP-(fatty) acid ligase